MPANHPKTPRAATLATLLVCTLLQACASSGERVADGLSAKGPHRYDAKYNFIHSRMARNADSTINVIVEIPAGTSEKWAVSEDGDSLRRDFTGDKPRVIDYLPYPGNYGMIPRTLLRNEDGGDGTALDVMVLGPAVPRGTHVKARAIGVIRVIDRGEQDDKILAVMQGPTLKGVYDLESLQLRYPGAAEIVGMWWKYAHGKRSKVEVLSAGSRGEASALIKSAMDSYKARDQKR